MPLSGNKLIKNSKIQNNKSELYCNRGSTLSCFRYAELVPYCLYLVYSLFHMKITVSVTKSSHQDCGLCYLNLPIFFLYIHYLLFCGKIKSCCDHCFTQQINPKTTVQLWDHSSVRIGFNKNNKGHTLPIIYTMLV